MTNFLTTYGTLFLGLFHTPQAYKAIVSRGWLSTLGFFFLSYVIGSVLSTGLFYARYLPDTIADFKTILTISAENLPEEVQVSWDADQHTLKFSGATLPVSVKSDIFAQDKSLTDFDSGVFDEYFFTLIDGDIDQNNTDYSDSFLVFATNGLQFKNTNTNQTGFIPYDEIASALRTVTDSVDSSSETSAKYLLQNAGPVLDSMDQKIRQYFPLVFLLGIPVLFVITLPNLVIAISFMILLLKLNNYSLTIPQTIRLTLLVSSIAMLVNQVTLVIYPTLNWPFYSMTFWAITFYLLIINKKLW